jgi:hypothetical protein
MTNHNHATPDTRLADIERLDLSALRTAWAARFGLPPPERLGRRLLELAAAYDLQERMHGRLKPALQRKLVRPTPQPGAIEASRRKRATTTTPGSRLVREWHGRSHTVEVSETGFLYAGQRYRSLSEIARTITGARWSGPRFFGL